MSDNVAEVPGLVVTYFAGPADQPYTRRRIQITSTTDGNAVAYSAHTFALLIDQLLEGHGPICPCGQHAHIAAGGQ